MENTNNIQIQKPLSLIIKDEREKLVQTINSIELHPVLLEMLMREIYLEVQNQAKYVSEREMQEYAMQSINVNTEATKE